MNDRYDDTRGGRERGTDRSTDRDDDRDPDRGWLRGMLSRADRRERRSQGTEGRHGTGSAGFHTDAQAASTLEYGASARRESDEGRQPNQRRQSGGQPQRAQQEARGGQEHGRGERHQTGRRGERGDDEHGLQQPDRQERIGQRRSQQPQGGRRMGTEQPPQGESHRQRQPGQERGRQHRSQRPSSYGGESEGGDPDATGITALSGQQPEREHPRHVESQARRRGESAEQSGRSDSSRRTPRPQWRGDERPGEFQPSRARGGRPERGSDRTQGEPPNQHRDPQQEAQRRGQTRQRADVGQSDEGHTPPRSGGGLEYEQQGPRDESGSWTGGEPGRHEEDHRGGRENPREHAQQPGQRRQSDETTSTDEPSTRRHVHEGDQDHDGTRHDHY